MHIRIRRCTGRSIYRSVRTARSSSPGCTGPYTGRCRRLRTVRCTVAGYMGRRMRAVRAASGRRPCTAGPGTARRSAAPAGAAQGEPYCVEVCWSSGCGMYGLVAVMVPVYPQDLHIWGRGAARDGSHPARIATFRSGARREPISRPASRSRRRCDAPGWPAMPPTRT